MSANETASKVTILNLDEQNVNKQNVNKKISFDQILNAYIEARKNDYDTITLHGYIIQWYLYGYGTVDIFIYRDINEDKTIKNISRNKYWNDDRNILSGNILYYLTKYNNRIICFNEFHG